MENNQLEKYKEHGISGTPQIKGQENRMWLGEFRERIIFALTQEQIKRKEALKVVKDKINNGNIDKIILREDISESIKENYMDIAQKAQKNYKEIHKNSTSGEIVLVLASNEAVNQKEVLLKELPILPEKFYKAKSNKLCKKHMEELEDIAPLFVSEFEEIGLFDKLGGAKCAVCTQESE